MVHMPKISVIMPVYNVENYLRETLECITAQTFKDFEIICVDDGSTDSSVEILREYAKKDSRFVLMSQSNAGGGAARNFGCSKAKGEYVIFLDSDDLFSPELLEKSYAAAVEHQADIVAFNFSRFDEEGNSEQRKGVHDDWIPQNVSVFNYKDCPDLIMSIVNPTPWNKLYRRMFIRDNGLKYEEISSSNDITFAAVSVACADRITYIEDSLVQYRIGHAGTITSTKAKKLNNVIIAVSSAVKQAKALSYSDIIINSIHRFTVDNYIFALKNNVVDFSDSNARDFYQHAHEMFNEPEYENITAEELHNDELYRAFCTVRKHDYETMQKLVEKRLIVSLTTYPARVGTLSMVLDTIYAQTRQADAVILWLAEEQFPEREMDLPEDLRMLVREGRLTVRWCDDLKPHKKYFYALQEYTNDLVVTIDDDLLYPAHILDKLYQSFLLYPDAVSTVRAHLIVISESGEILPYENWIKETDACIYQPSMQLLATGGAGTLYPPGLFRKEMFDKEAIMETCLWADDLWLKAMQLVSDVPVVVAQPFEGLKYLPGSQVSALCHQNVDQNQNDVQFAKINDWLNFHFEQGILVKKLTTLDIGVKLLGIEALCRHFSNERKAFRSSMQMLRRKLQNTYDEKSEINAKLQRTYNEKSEINAKLQRTYKEKAERGFRIKELEAENRRLKKEIKDFQKIKQSKLYRLVRYTTRPVRKFLRMLRSLVA